MFAKLFESEKYGQILIKKDIDDEGAPSLSFSVEPEGFGVCAIASVYDDSDAGYDMQEEVFERADLAMAEQAASSIFDLIQDSGVTCVDDNK